MPQNLPIQGAQVQEIQGGMRLTPLGLRQLGAEANAVSLPAGGPIPMTAPAAGATTTLTGATHAPIEPTRLLFSIPNQNYTGLGTYSLALDGYGFTMTSVEYIVLVAGHGSGNEVVVKNGSDDFATLDTASSTINLPLPSTKITYDATKAVVAKGGPINVTATGGAADKTLGLLIINGFVSS